ncbi:NAD-dependent epimerase/dehydratase family protein [Enterovibrio norvegicus]|uniref:NAD-dependent epimerase/dehydratase family protein n=1 Tax=Enterovibrio norvegicus TaxID=188144 RepID=A0ABV4KWC0_9GAMM|nr:NAD(P)-dependent oxidoreductase [Enterovibrio norvegicus]OEF58811.1 hypothetical protein A1OU_11690 [Enterovibrio norvegicus]
MNNKHNKTVVLTGASGFIGTHLKNELLSRDYEVIAISRNPLKYSSINGNVKWVSWSCIDAALSQSKTPCAIIHLSTNYGRNNSIYSEVEEVNIKQPKYVFELAEKYGIPLFINTDSFFCKEKFNYKYMESYISSKKIFREIGENLSVNGSVSFVNMQLEHVYGEGDGHDKFISFITRSLTGKLEKIECTTCEHKRDFIYIEDVVSAYMTILEKFNNVEMKICAKYEVGTGKSYMLKEMIELIKENVKDFDGEIIYGAIPLRNDEIMDSTANNEELKKLGWKPKYELETGVKIMLERDWESNK